MRYALSMSFNFNSYASVHFITDKQTDTDECDGGFMMLSAVHTLATETGRHWPLAVTIASPRRSAKRHSSISTRRLDHRPVGCRTIDIGDIGNSSGIPQRHFVYGMTVGGWNKRKSLEINPYI